LSGEVLSPGEVLLIVVPGANSAENQDPTTPLATSQMLVDIQSYLQQRASPFVTLKVCNPLYVRITVTASVIFTDTANRGDNLKRLNQNLIEYLSPWFYDAARAATDGNYVEPDQIMTFIIQLDYVDSLVSIEFSYSPSISDLPNCGYYFTSAQNHQLSSAAGARCAGITPLTQQLNRTQGGQADV
jgi:hypothetical protein